MNATSAASGPLNAREPVFGNARNAGASSRAVPSCPRRPPRYVAVIDMEDMKSGYKCRNCGRLVSLKEGEPVRCNYCGYRILYKVRPTENPKKVKAR